MGGATSVSIECNHAVWYFVGIEEVKGQTKGIMKHCVYLAVQSSCIVHSVFSRTYSGINFFSSYLTNKRVMGNNGV